MAAKDSNPKTIYGQAKPPLGLVPGTALVLLAEAFRDGADKYGPANWRIDPVSMSTYYSAAMRHMAAYQDGEDIDKSGVPHLAHAAANLCILMDAAACGTLIDDRPPTAPTGDLIRAKTRNITPVGELVVGPASHVAPDCDCYVCWGNSVLKRLEVSGVDLG